MHETIVGFLLTLSSLAYSLLDFLLLFLFTTRVALHILVRAGRWRRCNTSHPQRGSKSLLHL